MYLVKPLFKTVADPEEYRGKNLLEALDRYPVGTSFPEGFVSLRVTA